MCYISLSLYSLYLPLSLYIYIYIYTVTRKWFLSDLSVGFPFSDPPLADFESNENVCLKFQTKAYNATFACWCRDTWFHEHGTCIEIPLWGTVPPHCSHAGQPTKERRIRENRDADITRQMRQALLSSQVVPMFYCNGGSCIGDKGIEFPNIQGFSHQ